MATLIRPLVEASAGAATVVAAAAVDDAEVLTACRDGSGNLLLIGWLTAPGGFAIQRAGDTAGLAGQASLIALAVLGRRAVTAVRDGSNNLLMISWDLPPGLASITRPWPQGTEAGEVSAIAMATLGTDMLITAVRNGSDDLELISWRLEADATVSRLHDSGSQAGAISAVAITALDDGNVITAVRNGSGDLELIGWSVDGNGALTRWPGDPGAAGGVGFIALDTLTTSATGTTVFTAVTDASGDLLLIAWTAGPTDGFTRLADAGAGEAVDLAITTTVTPAGTPTVLVSMRQGSGNLKIIAFDVLGDASGMVLVRTGDYANRADADVTDTTLLTLDPDRILTACRTDNNLDLTTYQVDREVITLIRPLVEASAGAATVVAAAAVDDAEVLTACRDGSGNLLLIGWLTAPGGFAIQRAGDTAGLAGQASLIALAVLGRRAVTAVRDGSNNLLMISWDLPPGLASITRPWPQGTEAGEVSAIAMATLGTDMLITAVRNGSDDLELISWRLEADATVSRLHDSGSQAGAISAVAITALDDGNVITAVRNGSGDLELIGWSVDGNGALTRWPGDPGAAGGVGFIALDTLTTSATGTTVFTAVTDASGDLLLIAWTAGPTDGFTRLADAGAGEAVDLAITTTVTPAGTPTVLVSMRQGSGNLKIIAFDVLGDASGMVLVRTGDYANRADADVTDTTLLTLDPDRILTACRTDNNLDLTTYQVDDAGTVPAPANILGIAFENPPMPGSDVDWAVSKNTFLLGDTFPLARDHEWVQVLAPDKEYEEDSVVGCSGWIVGPNDSGADVPMTHSLGFDWEYHVALDEDPTFATLLSPAEIRNDDDRLQLAEYLGLPAPRGLLGVEWDKNLLPPSFRGQVNNGDRVALFGRWIVDTGHVFDGHYRSEVHPPLLMASASVQTPKGSARPITRMLLVSRPFLHGQEFAQDVNNVDLDSIDDDGPMLKHLVRELERVIWGHSAFVEAHPKIKERPYKGRYELHLLVEPPEGSAPVDHDLVVSYQFTVRNGCSVRISGPIGDHVEVVVELGELKGGSRLPQRTERIYQPDELDKLSTGVGLDISIAKIASYIAGAIGGVGALYVYYILRKGIRTDEYAPLPAVNIRDASQSVHNVPVQNVTPGAGIVVNNEQPWPAIGWLEVSWVPRQKD